MLLCEQCIRQMSILNRLVGSLGCYYPKEAVCQRCGAKGSEMRSVDVDDMGYRILWSRNLIDLEEMVRDRMALGWKPLGGVSVSRLPIQGEDFRRDEEFYQAMSGSLPPH